MKKKILFLAAAMGLTLGLAATAYGNEWKQDERGWWYQYDNGSYPNSGMRLIDGQEYLFGSDGYLMTGWQTYEHKWYYIDGAGNKLTGWQNLADKWYYFDETGIMKSDMILKLGAKWYYLKGDGSMATEDFTLDGVWYSPDPATGLLQRGKKDSKNPNLKHNADGSVSRKNASGEWVLMENDALAEALKEAIKDDYLKEKYKDTEAFETDARDSLNGLCSEVDIEDYIISVENEYNDTQGWDKKY